MKLNEAKKILNDNGYELLDESADMIQYVGTIAGFMTAYWWLKYLGKIALSPVNIIKTKRAYSKMIQEIQKDPSKFGEGLFETLINHKYLPNIIKNKNRLKVDNDSKNYVITSEEKIIIKTAIKNWFEDQSNYKELYTSDQYKVLKPLYFETIKLYYLTIMYYFNSSEDILNKINYQIEKVKKENSLFSLSMEEIFDNIFYRDGKGSHPKSDYELQKNKYMDFLNDGDIEITNQDFIVNKIKNYKGEGYLLALFNLLIEKGISKEELNNNIDDILFISLKNQSKYNKNKKSLDEIADEIIKLYKNGKGKI